MVCSGRLDLAVHRRVHWRARWTNRNATSRFRSGIDRSQDRLNAPDHDYNFDTVFFEKIKLLVQGPEACGYEHGDWAYMTSRAAGYIHNWSPYAEVRAVTLPYDDPAEPCETFRAYFLGFFWVIIVTGVNTCTSDLVNNMLTL
jgi:hypothetical protein